MWVGHRTHPRDGREKVREEPVGAAKVRRLPARAPREDTATPVLSERAARVALVRDPPRRGPTKRRRPAPTTPSPSSALEVALAQQPASHWRASEGR